MKNQQKAITLPGFLALIVGGSLLSLVLFKVLPLYLQNYTVSTILSGLNDKDFRRDVELSQSAIRSRVLKQLDINNINFLGPRDIDIKRSDKGYEVSIDYARTINFIDKIDMTFKFNNSVVVTKREN